MDLQPYPVSMFLPQEVFLFFFPLAAMFNKTPLLSLMTVVFLKFIPLIIYLGSAGIIGHSIVIHDDKAPEHRGNRNPNIHLSCCLTLSLVMCVFMCCVPVLVLLCLLSFSLSLSFHTSFSFYVCLFVSFYCLSVCLPCMSVFACLCFSFFLSHSVYLSPSLSLWFCLCFSLSACLCVWMSWNVWLDLCISLFSFYPIFCLHIYRILGHTEEAWKNSVVLTISPLVKTSLSLSGGVPAPQFVWHPCLPLSLYP